MIGRIASLVSCKVSSQGEQEVYANVRRLEFYYFKGIHDWPAIAFLVSCQVGSQGEQEVHANVRCLG